MEVRLTSRSCFCLFFLFSWGVVYRAQGQPTNGFFSFFALDGVDSSPTSNFLQTFSQGLGQTQSNSEDTVSSPQFQPPPSLPTQRISESPPVGPSSSRPVVRHFGSFLDGYQPGQSLFGSLQDVGVVPRPRVTPPQPNERDSTVSQESSGDSQTTQGDETQIRVEGGDDQAATRLDAEPAQQFDTTNSNDAEGERFAAAGESGLRPVKPVVDEEDAASTTALSSDHDNGDKGEITSDKTVDNGEDDSGTEKASSTKEASDNADKEGGSVEETPMKEITDNGDNEIGNNKETTAEQTLDSGDGEGGNNEAIFAAETSDTDDNQEDKNPVDDAEEEAGGEESIEKTTDKNGDDGEVKKDVKVEELPKTGDGENEKDAKVEGLPETGDGQDAEGGELSTGKSPGSGGDADDGEDKKDAKVEESPETGDGDDGKDAKVEESPETGDGKGVELSTGKSPDGGSDVETGVVEKEEPAVSDDSTDPVEQGPDLSSGSETDTVTEQEDTETSSDLGSDDFGSDTVDEEREAPQRDVDNGEVLVPSVPPSRKLTPGQGGIIFSTPGEAAKSGVPGTSYPVALRLGPLGDHLCAGVLIAPQYVLTAGHCVDPRLAGVGRPSVLIGSANGKKNDLEVMAVVSTTFHPQYGIDFEPDLAILKLDRESSHPPIILASEDAELESGAELILFGWNRSGKSAQELVLEYVDTETCMEKLRKPVKDHQMCMGGSGKGTCSGDDGGPIVQRDPKTEIDILYGVVGGNHNCDDWSVPDVHTTTVPYMDWIKEHVSSQSAKPENTAVTDGTPGAFGGSFRSSVLDGLGR